MEKLKSFFQALIHPQSSPSKVIVILLLGFVGLIAFVEPLKPVREFLDSENLSIVIGNYRLSAYLVLKGGITIALLIWLAGWASRFSQQQIHHLSDLSIGNRAILAKIAQIIIYMVMGIFALDVLGINLTALTVLSGAIGIGIGFGLQKITANFISGLILLFEKAIEEGSMVELQDGTWGTIKSTRARYTLIESFDGKEILMPNEHFITSPVINWTYTNTKARIQIDMGVAYGSDLELVKRLMLEAANEHPARNQDYAPACFVDAFADFSINFVMFFWVSNINNGLRGPKSDVLMAISKKFAEHGIEIPFPRRDIQMLPPIEPVAPPTPTKKPKKTAKKEAEPINTLGGESSSDDGN